MPPLKSILEMGDISSEGAEQPGMPSICGFGNAQNLTTAKYAADQWPHIPIWFTIWDQDLLSANTSEAQPRIHFLNGRNSNHAEGWALALAAVQKSGTKCDYFFSIEDDLEWKLSDIGEKLYTAGENHVQILQSVLTKYKPAVVVFRWPYGDTFYKPLMRLNEKFKDDLVQPATGFDYGCVLFHKDVIDFFIPIWLGRTLKPLFIIQFHY